MGEFVTSFDCKDCLQKTSELKNHTHIIPCGKRAALDYNVRDTETLSFNCSYS